jgi:hypothetical protein
MPQVWTWLEDADTQILQGEKHVPKKNNVICNSD